MDRILFVVTGAVTVIAGILAFCFLLSWPVYMLWNGCLVDAVQGVREVTWLQAWGISVLFGLLFKSNVSSKKD
jgi:hypothetical protein